MYHYILLCDLFSKMRLNMQKKVIKYGKKKISNDFKNLALYEVSKSSVVSVL